MTALEQDNLVNVLSGDPVIRACVTCKFYNSRAMSEKPSCTQAQVLMYHPVTGKKEMMGKTYFCEDTRCVTDNHNRRPEEPCGPDGKFYVEKGFKPTWLARLGLGSLGLTTTDCEKK